MKSEDGEGMGVTRALGFKIRTERTLTGTLGLKLLSVPGSVFIPLG